MTGLPRWRAVDAVRGFVIAVMALDHIRDFLGNAHFDATDLEHTTGPIFASRWITHLCAPTFFMLAGASAFLSVQSGRRSIGDAARFLLVRGLILVVVEQTALRCFGWYFHFDYHFMNAGVLYGLGLCMVMMSGLVRLRPEVSLWLGVAIIVAEPAIAHIDLGDNPAGTVWALLARSRDFEPVDGYHFYVSYPPIPWLGAMAFGYGLAHAVVRPDGIRRGLLIGAGLGFLLVFAIVRGVDVWDSPWSVQSTSLFTAMSFVNLSKYPPSAPFLLLMLGIAMLLLAAVDRWPTPGRVFEVYGRVPLFFYLIHIPLIHLIAVIYSYAAFGDASWLTSGPVIFWDTPLPGSPPDYGLGLGPIYLVWIGFVTAMYPLCRWRARARS